jgi:hypothetical protein
VRVVDLTHTFRNGMPVFPGLPQPSFAAIAKVEENGYAMTSYSMLNHIGTHVDAPAHQIAGGDTLDEIGLERLVTDALTLDVSHRDPHGAIPLGELEPHLDKVRHGGVLDRLVVSGRRRVACADRPRDLRDRLRRAERGPGRLDHLRAPPHLARLGPDDPRERLEPRPAP